MNAHTVLWTSPAPLWGRFGSAAFSAADQPRPAILRFATDEFMEQLLAMLAADPRQIGHVIARPETWRTPADEPPDLVERVPLPRIARTLARMRRSQAASTPLEATTHKHTTRENNVERTLPLKLYHPAHQRHYLVAANLVCGLPGFPDRAVATGGREQIGFVLRRLLPVKNGSDEVEAREEYAFIKDSTGARWQRVSPGAADDPFGQTVDGEEMLPLFPLNFRDDVDHPRRLLAGMIPVGRREEYMTTGAQAEPPLIAIGSGGSGTQTTASTDATAMSARKEQLKLDVIEPWKNLVRTAHTASDHIKQGDAKAPATKQDTVRSTNELLQAQSWLLLLDFADYLSLHVPAVWAAIETPAKKTDLGVGTPARALFDWLNGTGTAPGAKLLMTATTPTFASSLRDALAQVRASDAVRKGLEGAVRTYPNDPGTGLAWPPFRYLLAGVQDLTDFPAWGIHTSLDGITPPEAVQDDDQGTTKKPVPLVEVEAAFLDKLVPMVIKAIDTTKPAAPAPPVPFAARLRDAIKTTNGDAGWFRLRCAYVRCDCGPLQPVVLSAPSQAFQLASFFDPDAPARPIRIGLPIDTTPAGIRKFNKNTAFVMSDVLCGQVQRAKGLGFIDLVMSVLPWPLHKDLDVGGEGPCEANNLNIGMICSLSIPIITICALILLMIIVMLLDLIFKWIPWFVICFPLPGFKAKK